MSSDASNELRVYLPEHDLMLLAGSPAVYHCHHFNLFLDQTIDDALGSAAGGELRFAAAREAASQLLAAFMIREGIVTPVERLQAAATLFSNIGHGTLRFNADASGGTASGSHLHYGFSWREKYGAVVRRRHPADAFAAGFAAAALEVAYGLSPLSVRAKETQCVATRAAECQFELSPGVPTEARKTVGSAECREQVQPSFGGLREEEIAGIAGGLRDFTAGVSGDERGLVQAFGVFVTMHLANYYNRISYDALQHVIDKMPQVQGAIEDLLRESGHVCVFNTFGGILLSPEWEGLVGPLTGDPTDVVAHCLAIGRALGFGHWTLVEMTPGERVVLRTPSSYESVYYLTRHGQCAEPREYFLQGAALAITQLAHSVPWTERPKLTQGFYDAQFRGGQLPWRFEQTHSLIAGETFSEIVVTKRRS